MYKWILILVLAWVILGIESCLFGQGLTLKNPGFMASIDKANSVAATCPSTNGAATYENTRDGYGFSFNASSKEIRCERWTPTINTNVCSVGFYLSTVSGDTSSKTITYSIRTGTPPAYTTLLASNSFTGFNDGGAGTLIVLSFSPAVALTSGTPYVIAVDQGVVDVSNFIQIGFNNTTGLGDGAGHGSISDWFISDDAEHLAIKLWAY